MARRCPANTWKTGTEVLLLRWRQGPLEGAQGTDHDPCHTPPPHGDMDDAKPPEKK